MNRIKSKKEDVEIAMSIPGIAFTSASSILAEIGNYRDFENGSRDFLISSGIAKFTINFTNIDCNQSKTQKIIKSLIKSLLNHLFKKLYNT
jgi:Transposase IS116/IS110/IS902 family